MEKKRFTHFWKVEQNTHSILLANDFLKKKEKKET